MIYPSGERKGTAFAIRYVRWLMESEITVAAGPDAFALLVAVVMTEDRVFYNFPPNFYNEQLCRASGIGSIPALIRARSKAIELGLLAYQAGAKRRPGIYFVSGFHNDSLQNRELFSNDSLPKAQLSVSESETKAPPSIPIPIPIPIPKPDDAEFNSWVDWWNSLADEGLVHAGVRKTSNLQNKFRAAMQNGDLRESLQDRSVIEQRIRESDFLRGSWFTLPKLFGGKNKTGEWILHKVIDGGYAKMYGEQPHGASTAFKFDGGRKTKGELDWEGILSK